MKFKRLTATFLVIATLLSYGTSTLAVNSSFSDISDSATAVNADVLRLMGVVTGTGSNSFSPNATLTRAQFCAMVVAVMGKADEADAMKRRTIFSDVGAAHWARGYINLAATTSPSEKDTGRLVSGVGNGKFLPDKSITYGEAVTILMRMLCYAPSDVGAIWPDDFMNAADSIGLTNGLSLSASAIVNRAQAAQLFVNLLNTDQKGGTQYASTLGTLSSNCVLLSSNGTDSTVLTSSGSYLVADERSVPSSLNGQRGSLLLNTKGELITFLPSTTAHKTVTVSSAEATYVMAGGTKYTIPSAAVAYLSNGTTSTFGTAYVNVLSGSQLTIYYTSAGKVESVYISTGSSDSVVIAQSAGTVSSFSSLLGGATGYTIMKNGAKISESDIAKYDVISYDAGANIIYVSDNKVTGYYESASPSAKSPAKVRLLGHDFTVLDAATDNFSSLALGDTITLLLTQDGSVAGAVPSSTVRSKLPGIVTACSANSATVKLANGIEVSGNPGLTDSSAAQKLGQLVTVSSDSSGRISLGSMTYTSSSSAFDVKNLTVGGTSVVPYVRIYERVGTSKVAAVFLSKLAQTTIPASQVLAVSKNAAGKIDTILLSNATGDLFTYGTLSNSGGSGTVTVTNGSAATTKDCNYSYANGSFGGVAISADDSAVIAVATLTAVKGVSRSAFNGTTSVSAGNLSLPISDKVQCYNATTKAWITGDNALEQARAFSQTLTVYYDQCGKVRIVATE